MPKVERFYLGKQIGTPAARSERRGGGVPIATASRSGDMVYTCGVVATDPGTGQLVGPGDIRAQTRCVLENLKKVLALAGTSFEHVVLVQAFLKDILSDWRAYHDVYLEYFDEHRPPPRFTVQAPMVTPDFLVEIQMTAAMPARARAARARPARRGAARRPRTGGRSRRR